MIMNKENNAEKMGKLQINCAYFTTSAYLAKKEHTKKIPIILHRPENALIDKHS